MCLVVWLGSGAISQRKIYWSLYGSGCSSANTGRPDEMVSPVSSFDFSHKRMLKTFAVIQRATDEGVIFTAVLAALH